MNLYDKHEKLKILASIIGYTTYSKYWQLNVGYLGVEIKHLVDINTIIFSSQFQVAFENYMFENEKYAGMWENEILKHLDNPLKYIELSINNVEK